MAETIASSQLAYVSSASTRRILDFTHFARRSLPFRAKQCKRSCATRHRSHRYFQNCSYRRKDVPIRSSNEESRISRSIRRISRVQAGRAGKRPRRIRVWLAAPSVERDTMKKCLSKTLQRYAAKHFDEDCLDAGGCISVRSAESRNGAVGRSSSKSITSMASTTTTDTKTCGSYVRTVTRRPRPIANARGREPLSHVAGTHAICPHARAWWNGRHVGLRSQCLTAWGFESPRSHFLDYRVSEPKRQRHARADLRQQSSS